MHKHCNLNTRGGNHSDISIKTLGKKHIFGKHKDVIVIYYWHNDKMINVFDDCNISLT